ncbi:hypothetical protein [Thalassiella azotivora]
MMEILGAIVPSIGVGLLFWLAIRAILRADQRERAAMAKLDRDQAQEARRAGSPPAAQRTQPKALHTRPRSPEQ